MPPRAHRAGSLLVAVFAMAAPNQRAPSPVPSIVSSLQIDTVRLDGVDVAIHLENVPSSFRLAMKVHPEYDAKYWRNIDSLRVEGSANDRVARIARVDSTLWQVTMPGGRGVLHYRVRVQPQTGAVRDAWRPCVRATGALISTNDFLLYLPEFTLAPARVTLAIPVDWRIATSLIRAVDTSSVTLSAPDAATLLDAPILLGRFREWVYADRGTTFHVVYWPLPDATPFDTLALVDRLQRLTRATLDVFGRAPSPDFYFMLQDGALDALEHKASVAIGMPSALLGRDPHALTTEIAHEFFHTWNLVAIHPDRYGELSFRKPLPTSGLWWGEGVTLRYADALSRRAGIADSMPSRLDHLRDVLRSYYAAWWSNRVSPARASLAFGESPISNPDATGSYYTQGELLAEEIDALVRDSTRDRRSLDDVMRAMFARSRNGRGFTASELEAVSDSVCDCRLAALFATQVKGHALIDVRSLLARLGLRLVVDSIQAVDRDGAPTPDLRIGADFTRAAPPLRLVVANPASAWMRAGLRTGDELTALEGTPIQSFDEFRRVLRGLHVGQTVGLDIRRDGKALHLAVAIAGYTTPRVQFLDVESVSAQQRANRARWLAGW